MARLLRDRPLAGTAITFGVQKVSGDAASVERLLRREGFPVRPVSADLLRAAETDRADRLHQSALFAMLGFDHSESIDVFENERPDHLLDLNEPLPESMYGRYAMVCDGGTTEHCFDPPEVLANAVRLLAPGGLVVHSTPISGWVMHGYYQLSPNLIFQFYEENGFEDLDARVVYSGRCIDPFEYMPRRDFLGQRALLVFVARKGERAGPVRAPVQFRYATPQSERLMRDLGRGLRSGHESGIRSLFLPHRLALDAWRAVRGWASLAWHARRL